MPGGQGSPARPYLVFGIFGRSVTSLGGDGDDDQEDAAAAAPLRGRFFATWPSETFFGGTDDHLSTDSVRLDTFGVAIREMGITAMDDIFRRGGYQRQTRRHDH